MTVKELITKLEKVPGDYVVGSYFVPSTHSPRFRILDKDVGVNNNKRFVAISCGQGIPCTMSDLRDTIEV